MRRWWPTPCRRWRARCMRMPIRLNAAITVYLLATAVCLPISGWVADQVWRQAGVHHRDHRLCERLRGERLRSQSDPASAGANMCQGAAGAMMGPVGRLVLLRSTPRHDLVRAMSVLTMPALLGPVLGPPIGGSDRHVRLLALDILPQPSDRAGGRDPGVSIHQGCAGGAEPSTRLDGA